MKCDTIPELKRFLSIQEQALGTASPEVATTVSKLADLYLGEGKLDDAEALYRRALAIRERLIGPHRTEVEESKRSLNKVLALKGDRLERISSEMKAAGNSRAAPSSSSSHRASVNLKQSGTFATVKKAPQAPSFSPAPTRHNPSEQAQTWYGASGASGHQQAYNAKVPSRDHGPDQSFRPSDSSCILDAVPESMQLVSSAEALTEAIREARLEVDLVRQLSGADANQLADCLTHLADLLCRCKRYQEMEPILVEALNIRERRFGPFNQLVATSLKNLARLYYFQGAFDRAQPLFERALSIRRQVFGDNNMKVADVLDQYGKLLRKMQRHAEAHKCEQEAQAIKSRSQGWRPL